MGAEVEPNLFSDLPTPTTHPLFQQAGMTPETIAPVPAPASSPTAASTRTAAEKENYVEALTGLTYSDLITKTIYEDTLDANWTLVTEDKVEVDLESTAYVHNGRFAIAMTPLDTWQRLYFGVREDAAESYLADDVLAIRFWLNGGRSPIELHDLAFTVVGSNDYPYWVENDTSAYYDDEFPFSETALYHLGLNGSIPAETWVEIEVYIHELIYDPDYRFITGFYLKNADDFFSTVYIDDISFIMLPDPDANSSVESVTATPDVTVEPDIVLTATLTPTAAITTTPPISQTADCVVDPPPGWELYAIQAGDVLSNIALERNVAVDTVASVNCFEQDIVLSINRRIWLPASAPDAAEPPTPASLPSP